MNIIQSYRHLLSPTLTLWHPPEFTAPAEQKIKRKKKKTFERLNRKLKWPFLHVVIGIHRHLFLSYLLKALQRPAGLGGPAAVIVRESGHARSPSSSSLQPHGGRKEKRRSEFILTFFLSFFFLFETSGAPPI
jgi:hypothetical protein